MNPRWSRPAALLGLLVIEAACRAKGDPVRAVLDDVVASARSRNAAAVVSHLASDYRDAAGQSRSDAEQQLRRLFAAYEIVDVSIRDVSFERSEGAARARFQAEFSGQPRRVGGISGLFPSKAIYAFDLRLVPIGRDWKIAWAFWEEASPVAR